MSLTLRHRTIDALTQAAQDPRRRTTRERLWLAADRLSSIDQEMARALGNLLIGADDDPHSRTPRAS